MNKKGSKKSPVKRRASFPTESVLKLKKIISTQAQEIREGAEQQKATSAILRVIASSPTDIQPVLDALAESPARLCEVTDAQINRLEGEVLRRVASYGSMPTPYDIGGGRPFNRGHVGGRAVIDRQTIHIHDLPAAATEFPGSVTRGIRLGIRTALATPLLRDGVPLGCIHIRRTEVRPFSDRQFKLLETFSDQAVIAIENVRLFKEKERSITSSKSSARLTCRARESTAAPV
jgi:GAF domain-containing protein